LHDIEVATVVKRGDERSTVEVARFVEDDRREMVDHRVDRVAEDDELHDRERENHGKRPPVMPDLQELLADDCDYARAHELRACRQISLPIVMRV